MKRLILFISASLITLTSFGQHGGIYGDWYLTYYEVDGTHFGVSAILPPISPSLTIGIDLEISGIAACNNYSGNFTYDVINDLLIVENIEATTNTCEFQSHTNFETDYFTFFTNGNSFSYAIIYGTNDDEFLQINLPNGDNLHYSPYPILLNSNDSGYVEFDMYPNPVSTILHVASERSQIAKLSVYATTGQPILTKLGPANSIDVSLLADGIYFLEMVTETGRQVQKFIKN